MSKKIEVKLGELKTFIQQFWSTDNSNDSKITFLFGSGINKTFAKDAFNWDELKKISIDQYVKKTLKDSSKQRESIVNRLNSSLTHKMAASLVDKTLLKKVIVNEYSVILDELLKETSNNYSTNVLSLNFDTFIEEVTQWTNINVLKSKQPFNTGKNIYHLHGVVDKENYIQSDNAIWSLASYSNNKKQVKQFLNHYFSNKTNELVFIIGTSFEEEHILDVIKKIKENPKGDNKRFVLFQHFKNYAKISSKIKDVYANFQINFINYYFSDDIAADTLLLIKYLNKELNKIKHLTFSIDKSQFAYQLTEKLKQAKSDKEYEMLLSNYDADNWEVISSITNPDISNEMILSLLKKVTINRLSYFHLLSKRMGWEEVSEDVKNTVLNTLNGNLENMNNVFHNYPNKQKIEHILRWAQVGIPNSKYAKINHFIIFCYFKDSTKKFNLDIKDVIGTTFDSNSVFWKLAGYERFQEEIKNIEFSSQYFYNKNFEGFIKNKNFQNGVNLISLLINYNKDIENIFFNDNTWDIYEKLIKDKYLGFYINLMISHIKDDTILQKYRKLLNKYKGNLHFNPNNNNFSVGNSFFIESNEKIILVGEDLPNDYKTALSYLQSNKSIKIEAAKKYITKMVPIVNGGINEKILTFIKECPFFSIDDINLKSKEYIAKSFREYINLKSQVENLKMSESYSFLSLQFYNILPPEDIWNYISKIENLPEDNLNKEKLLEAIELELFTSGNSEQTIVGSKLLAKLFYYHKDWIKDMNDAAKSVILEIVNQLWFNYYNKWCMQSLKFEEAQEITCQTLKEVKVNINYTHRFIESVVEFIESNELNDYINYLKREKKSNKELETLYQKICLIKIKIQLVKKIEKNEEMVIRIKEINSIMYKYRLDLKIINWLINNKKNIEFNDISWLARDYETKL